MRIQPDLSVCVVSRDRPAMVRTFLRSLYRVAEPVLFEAIIVDNGSGSALAAQLEEEFPEVLFLEMGRPESWTEAVNRALLLAGGRYYGVFDDDVVLQPESLHRLLSHLDDHPEIGLAGPQVCNATGLIEPSAGRLPGVFSVSARLVGLHWAFPNAPWLRRQFLYDWDHSYPREVEWLAGSAMIVRREAVDEVGLLDEKFRHAFADYEFCLRCRRSGWHLLYFPPAGVVHAAPRRYDPKLILPVDPTAPDAPGHLGAVGDGLRYLCRRVTAVFRR